MALISLAQSMARHSFTRFLIVGGLNTAAGLGVAFALHYFWDFGRFASTSAAYGAGMIVSFGLNKAWTFSHRRGGLLAQQIPVFILINLAALGLSNLIIALIGPRTPYWQAFAVAIVITTLWNYWAMRSFVYKAASSA